MDFLLQSIGVLTHLPPKKIIHTHIQEYPETLYYSISSGLDRNCL